MGHQALNDNMERVKKETTESCTYIQKVVMITIINLHVMSYLILK